LSRARLTISSWFEAILTVSLSIQNRSTRLIHILRQRGAERQGHEKKF